MEATTLFHSRGDRIFGIVNVLLLAVVVISTLYPFIYILAVSLSSGLQVAGGNVFLYPVNFTLTAYEHVLSQRMFWVSYGNTFIITFGGTLASMLFIVPGAYALSRPQLKGRQFWNFMVAFTLWFHAGLIPFFLTMRDLGLLDSLFGIMVAFACNAFNIILLRNFFENIPKSFEEAARMDGANDFQVLWKVFIPLSKPALTTITLLCIVTRWNGYFWAMVLLRTEDKIPLQVFIKKQIIELMSNTEFASALLVSDFSFETVSAALMVASIIPVLILYPYLQKYFTKGLTMGGIKE